MFYKYIFFIIYFFCLLSHINDILSHVLFIYLKKKCEIMINIIINVKWRDYNIVSLMTRSLINDSDKYIP